MKKPCKKCATSGVYVEYSGSEPSRITGTNLIYPYHLVKCKFCNGTGYVEIPKVLLQN